MHPSLTRGSNKRKSTETELGGYHDAQGTPTQSRISPSILVYADKRKWSGIELEGADVRGRVTRSRQQVTSPGAGDMARNLLS